MWRHFACTSYFFKLHAKWRHVNVVLPVDFPQKIIVYYSALPTLPSSFLEIFKLIFLHLFQMRKNFNVGKVELAQMYNSQIEGLKDLISNLENRIPSNQMDSPPRSRKRCVIS